MDSTGRYEQIYRQRNTYGEPQYGGVAIGGAKKKKKSSKKKMSCKKGGVAIGGAKKKKISCKIRKSNPWVTFLLKYTKTHNLSYGEAMQSSKVKSEYQKWKACH